MRIPLLFCGTAAAAVMAAAVPAQDRIITREPTRARAFSLSGTDDADRAALGVSTASGGKRDSLGLLVTEVTPGGPAEKAGIEEGSRIAAVNGVNLRLSAADAGESDMQGMANRRLIRELQKVKAGADVELQLWSGGQTRTVRVRTVALEDLPGQQRMRTTTREDMEDRAVLGLNLGSSGTRRDSLGVLIIRVAPDGPAEKAGLVEGDRVAAVNGVNLRVAGEDAGDSWMGGIKQSRFTREMGKVKSGDDVELRVYSSGQFKTVRVRAARAGDLYKDEGRGMTIFFGDRYQEGGAGSFGPLFAPRPPMPPTPPTPMAEPWVRVAPRAQAMPRILRMDEGRRMLEEQSDRDIDRDIDRDTDEDARAEIGRSREAVERTRRALQDYRSEVERRVRGTATRTTSALGAETIGSAPYRTSYVYGTAGSGEMSVDGLRLAPVTRELARYFGEGSENGLLVLESAPGWANLRAGDVILAVNGRDVRDAETGSVTFAGVRDASIEVLRKGKRVVVR